MNATPDSNTNLTHSITSFNRLLDELEDLTGSLLMRSANLADSDVNELKAGIDLRAVLIRDLSEQLHGGHAVTSTEYDRMINVREEGRRIGANLQQVRSSIVAGLSCSSRDRKYAERLAGQLAGS